MEGRNLFLFVCFFGCDSIFNAPWYPHNHLKYCVVSNGEILFIYHRFHTRSINKQNEYKWHNIEKKLLDNVQLVKCKLQLNEKK